MYVVKRDGRHEKVHFDKITARLESLANREPKLDLDVAKITGMIARQVKSGMHTSQLDNLAAEICYYLSSLDYNYEKLALRVSVSNLHKQTKISFLEKTQLLKDKLNSKYYQCAIQYSRDFEKHIDYSRDYNYGYFGFNTLTKMYLLRDDGENIIERPQDMFMRTAIQIHLPHNSETLRNTLDTYDNLSKFYYTNATPTLLNAGLKRNSMCSCFLMTLDEDSVENMYDTLYNAACISKGAGGLSVCLSNIRSKGSLIKSTTSKSGGILPYIKMYDSLVGHIGQRTSGRKAGIAMYLDTHHADLMDFLQLKRNTPGIEELRCRNLFYGNMISDLFMKRVEKNEMWSLFDPAVVPGLYRKYGDDYEKEYIKYENQGLAATTIPAIEVMKTIAASMIETGSYYALFKDHINKKNPQQNLGTITSSNLCSEITLYSSDNEVAVCNLSSISLPKFTDGKNYDYSELEKVVRLVVRNLNHIIDINSYAVEGAKNSNNMHRPMGIGVQGLADVFFKHKCSFVSDTAKELNKRIFETIYYAAVSESCELAKIHGAYESFEGSPASKGILQPDFWNLKLDSKWDALKKDVMKYGLRNSTLIALMPTATTSQLIGNTESFEPITSNIYTRKTFAGDFIVINHYLVEDLKSIGMWNEQTKNKIIRDEGSVTNLDIPKELKEIYKTVWEYKQKDLMVMAAERAPFIDQTQSMNLYIADANINKVSSALMAAWKLGLKTGCYYLRVQANRTADKVTASDRITRSVICNEEQCTLCSS